MKTTFFRNVLRLIAVIAAFAFGFNAYADEATTVVYKHFSPQRAISSDNGTFRFINGRTININIPKKSERIKFYAGSINISVDEDLPARMQMMLDLAVDMWENTIQTTRPVNIILTRKPLDFKDQACLLAETEVRFYKDSEKNTFVPSSLFRQSHALADEDVDAVITLNNNIEWDFSTGEYASDFPNILSVLLKQIGRALGIGSSVVYENGLPVAMLPAPTIYDKLILNNEEKYFTDGCSSLSGEEYKKYAADYFVNNADNDKYIFNGRLPYKLNKADHNYYGNNGGFLFRPEGNEFAKNVTVDDFTTDLIHALGWTTSGQPPVYPIITGAPYPSALIPSYLIYSPHINTTVSCPVYNMNHISLTLPLANGGYWDGKIDYANVLTFGMIVGLSEQEFKTNINGDIYAGLSARFLLDDSEDADYTAPVSTRLSLLRKPQILNVSELDSYNSESNYRVPTIEVQYIGADELHIEISRSNGESSSFTVTQPVIAWFPIIIDPAVDSTIKIQAVNSEGIDSHTLFYAAEGAGVEEITESDIVSATSEAVYDVNGRFIGNFESGFDRSLLDPGIYIVISTKGKNVISRKKEIVK